MRAPVRMRQWSIIAVAAVAALTCGRTAPLRPVELPSDAGRDAGLVDAGFDAGVPDAGRVQCIPGHVTLTLARASVLFVLDRSGSMAFAYGTGTRWQALQDGLDFVLPAVETRMSTGAYFFPRELGGNGCDVSKVPEVPLALNNANAIGLELYSTFPQGGTPTAQAVKAASAVLRAQRTAQSARALVVVTDGEPNCNAELDPFTCTCTQGTGSCLFFSATACLDDTRTIDRIAEVADAGIPTWVIGIHDSNDDHIGAVLDRMALAGGRPRPGAPRYYPATDPSQLQKALASIADQIGRCTYLTASVPDAKGDLQLVIDGQPVPLEHWHWADRDNGELEVTGEPCTQLSVSAKVTATVACGAP